MFVNRILFALSVGVLIAATCSCGVVGPAGAVIAGVAAASGGGGGGGKTPVYPVTMSPGQDTPTGATIMYNASDTLVLQLQLLNNGSTNIDISSITLTADGTVNDADDFTAAKLYIDQNQDGSVDGGDTQIGGNQTFSSDNGTATFSFAASTVTQGTSELYLAVVNLSVGTADHNENFRLGVAQSSDLAIVESGTANPVTAGGTPAYGNFFTITGVSQLEVDEGNANPADGGVFEGATDVVMLQMRLSAGNLQAVTISSATFTASGTLNDATDITSVGLYRDVNNNGTLEPFESLVDPATKTYTVDNGTIAFDPNRTISAGQTENWLVVYDLGTGLTPNDTFQVRLVLNTNLATNATLVHGAPVNSAVKYIQGIGSVTVSSTTPPSNSSVPFVGEWPVLHLRFAAGANEPVDITSITIDHSATATANVATDVSQVRLYHDVNENGRCDSYADLLLATGNYSADSVTLSSFTLVCTDNYTTHALVQYVMAGEDSAASGRTHAVETDPLTQVVARGHDTLQPITPAGAPITGPTMTILRDTWVAVGASGLTARDDHTAVSTGTDVIIWGGRGGVTYYGNGSAYHPLENSWTPVSGTGAPSPRRLHCAVWTGKKMFIWGGYDGSTYLGNGGLYDPETNSWQTVSSLNAPSNRMDVLAVWTGSRIIVWGGYAAGGSYLDTGGRYDPETDTWVATNTSSLPAYFGRRNFAADWNGSGMIVWGGYNTDYQYLNDGGIYYPSSDSWSFTTTGGAPAERCLHTGVWCSDRFVVWGGYITNTYLASGAYYRSGGWTDVSTGAPAARQKHSAVWDGKQMTVWGGEDTTSTVTQTGSRLDPASRIWSSTSTTGAPSARRLHSATWVGAGMVIWGGSINTGGSTTNTGGRYLP